MFTSEVIDHLKYYVYRLIDPRNGQTFYVGKGIGNRVFSHAKGEEAADTDAMSDKFKYIREIKNDGFEVAHIIHRHGLDEMTAFEVEATLIDAYPEASNRTIGHYSNERGVMHAQQVIEQYQAKEIEFQHKILMISINRSATEANSIYEAVRYAWKIASKKAQRSDFVLALQQGVVIGVFTPIQWMEATKINFPGKDDIPGRWGFIGEEAPEDIKKLYLRTRLPDSMRKKGAANPIRYSY
jgi:hypothetical protein